MAPAADNALIVQSDCSVLLEVHAPRAGEARAAVAPFAELVKSPEHVHTYRLTPLSIWNARAAGLAAEQMVEALREHARYVVPPNVEQEILELAARYGRVVIRGRAFIGRRGGPGARPPAPPPAPGDLAIFVMPERPWSPLNTPGQDSRKMRAWTSSSGSNGSSWPAEFGSPPRRRKSVSATGSRSKTCWSRS